MNKELKKLLKKDVSHVFLITSSSYRHQLTEEGYIDGNKPSIPVKKNLYVVVKNNENVMDFHWTKGNLYTTKSRTVETVYFVENGEIVRQLDFVNPEDWIEVFGKNYKYDLGFSSFTKEVPEEEIFEDELNQDLLNLGLEQPKKPIDIVEKYPNPFMRNSKNQLIRTYRRRISERK
jgi:hypothetical protein